MRGKRSDIMNEVIKNILGRRSVRKFIEKEIPKGDLEQIVTAGIHAPSGMNKQLWHFSVVQNKELIGKAAEAIGRILGRDGYDFYRPDTLILVSNDRDNPHGAADSACALENMFLAAHSLGIGSVWINQFCGICDDNRLRPLLDEAKVPSNHTIYGVAALGYAEHPYNDSHRDTDGKIDFVL